MLHSSVIAKRIRAVGWFGDALTGISLQLYPQYKIGDWATLGGDKRGCVTRLGLFRTQLQTIHLDIISVKNSKVLGDLPRTSLYETDAFSAFAA